ncbi:hypothetical protein ABZX40_26100 [Streptomyces sp. NPDC004610]|uniref:hypothetical protein n=1 Tax=unclassified Streptomyces TaxID=2593676 RepID=UPI0033A86519
MTGTGWELYGDGHQQRAVTDIQHTPAQRAYLAYETHRRDCGTCSTDCPTAAELWGAYLTAKYAAAP